MPERSDKAFPETLKALLDEHEVSGRELMKQTRRHTGWGSAGHVSFLLNGELPPTIPGMEAIAKALKIRPEFFAEYRMRKAQESLDPSVVGFKKALANLKRYESD